MLKTSKEENSGIEEKRNRQNLKKLFFFLDRQMIINKREN
ncbi:uncharacterized protein METZ01_LOCUS427497 [marine metagenome]|uniref:Uncharacterized protein n=1 Tax=marine metagenome TaxID=408172 RepID=A0A382XUI0_9ZZZZ